MLVLRTKLHQTGRKPFLLIGRVFIRGRFFLFLANQNIFLPVWRSLVRSTNMYSGSEKHCDDGFLPEKWVILVFPCLEKQDFSLSIVTWINRISFSRQGETRNLISLVGSLQHKVFLTQNSESGVKVQNDSKEWIFDSQTSAHPHPSSPMHQSGPEHRFRMQLWGIIWLYKLHKWDWIKFKCPM